ncbi:hypothetical protein [Anabaena sp. UHCC 0187]|uniref:hypothetical protein n=1 Tax=Anabaena sp. UHCC 0187 TaxID=2590018 RepID=UPI0015805222|nr:hypothetical protein [Anabaena sp. UHCC 0187]
MRVVSNKVIFCEGGLKSLDSGLIKRLLENLSNQITIIPTGSKFNFSVFVQGYLYTDEQQNNQNYMIFRDRDFDIEPTTEIKLLQIDKVGKRIDKRTFLCHRTCVENYLLNPELIHNYWVTKYAEKLENPISKWGHKDSPGIDNITKWIEDAARTLLHYQAVRWALGNLCQLSASKKQLKTTWTQSGKIPISLILSDCKNEALSLINEFITTVSQVEAIKFEDSLNKYLQQFDQEEFWIQKQYLIWFDGKDIQAAMHKISQNSKLPYK